jgi:hypothetical protein
MEQNIFRARTASNALKGLLSECKQVPALSLTSEPCGVPASSFSSRVVLFYSMLSPFCDAHVNLKEAFRAPDSPFCLRRS